MPLHKILIFDENNLIGVNLLEHVKSRTRRLPKVFFICTT